MSNIWFFLIPSILLAYTGTKIRKPGNQIYTDWQFPWGPSTGSRIPGKIMFLIGATCTALGIYAVFFGPIAIGTITLPNSPTVNNAIFSWKEREYELSQKYSKKTDKKKKKAEYANAVAYAQAKVTVTGGWHMTGKTTRAYKGSVLNRGDRHLRSVTFQLKCKENLNQNLSVGDIAPFKSKDYSYDLGLSVWKTYLGGPYIVDAQYK